MNQQIDNYAPPNNSPGSEQRPEHPMAQLPSSVSIEIVRGCNLNCPMCLTERENDKVRRMGADLYQLIVDQMGTLGIPRLRFCGDGEPTLHSSIPDYVELAHAAGIKEVGITTNGTRLIPALVEKLCAAKLDFIAISLDAATEETYHQIRRGPYALTQVETHINNLLKYRDQWDWKIEVQVNFVVQPLNFHEFEIFWHRWEGMVDQVNLLRLTSQTTSRLAEFGVFEPCYMLREKLYVSIDGDIYPCFYLYEPMKPLGNVRDVPIGDIWAQKRAAVAKDESLVFTPLCHQCTWTEKHWRPGTPVMPHNMRSKEPLYLIRVSGNTR